MSDPVEFLDLDDVVDLTIALLGYPAAIRDIGLLGSAVARPQTTVFGEDSYPDIWTKAAALLHSIVKNHALLDGNKRLGWLATAVFLEINRIEISRTVRPYRHMRALCRARRNSAFVGFCPRLCDFSAPIRAVGREAAIVANLIADTETHPVKKSQTRGREAGNEQALEASQLGGRQYLEHDRDTCGATSRALSINVSRATLCTASPMASEVTLTCMFSCRPNGIRIRVSTWRVRTRWFGLTACVRLIRVCAAQSTRRVCRVRSSLALTKTNTPEPDSISTGWPTTDPLGSLGTCQGL